ncbi:MAG: methyl-accepting chemotaxis protein [Brevinema sp.]
MAYDNINSSVTKYSQKIIAVWILLSIFTIVCALFYFIKNSEHTLLQKNALYFTEISSEASMLLNNNIDIDSSKTSLSSWNILHKKQFLKTLPNAEAEINLLQEISEKFYSSLSSKNLEEKGNAFQEFYDQIELIKRIINSTIKTSFIYLFIKLILPVYMGFIFICIFMTLNGASLLSKKIIAKNSVVLENIWEELQSIDWESANTQNTSHKFNIEHLYSLLKYSNELPLKIDPIQKSISEYISKAGTTSINISDHQQSLDHLNNQDSVVLKEKILSMQKMLSRLFTRAERASTLAKSSSDNGFQAGILALNISIEASKAGDSGKVFMSVSDRVKNFAEKSSNIGHAIIEELRDADLVIRKSYAVAKNILETLPDIKNTAIGTPSHTTPTLDFSQLDQSAESLSEIKRICTHMKEQSSALHEYLLDYHSQENSKQPSISETKIILIRDGLVKNFEQLYRNTYGVDPIISQNMNISE